MPLIGVVLYSLVPQRVSAVQELQMITVLHDNVHVYRTEGNTDDQASVLKDIFSDDQFVKDYGICSINSINWARIATQSTYYVWAYLQVIRHYVYVNNMFDMNEYDMI